MSIGLSWTLVMFTPATSACTPAALHIALAAHAMPRFGLGLIFFLQYSAQQLAGFKPGQ